MYGAMTAIIYYASVLYERGEIDIGSITSFLFYLIMLLINFGMMTAVIGNMYSMLGASDKIVDIMNMKPKINTKGGDTISQSEIKGSLEIQDLKFRYPSKPDVEVLKGVHIDVSNENKRVIALCGSSGCGKSSIISMIERFYDPTEG